MKIIGSIYIRGNATVRATYGDLNKCEAYDKSPIEVANEFEDNGIKLIYLVDLDGAVKKSPKNLHALEMISEFTKLKINFTGGLYENEHLGQAFLRGADLVTISSVAVHNKDLFMSWYLSWGRKKIVLACDVFDNFLRTGGWKESSKINIFDHLDYYYEKGIRYIKVTDISKEGSLSGPSIKLYEEIMKRFPNFSIYAGGGVRNVDDLKRLSDLGIYGTIIGKAYYDGRLSLKDLKDFTS